MLTKLDQMDTQLREVVDALVHMGGPGQPHSNTLLLVCGDHGQTLTGDHGGASAEETDSPLLALHVGRYAEKRSEAAPVQGHGCFSAEDEGPSAKDRCFSEAAQGDCSIEQGSLLRQTPMAGQLMPQIDLAPTLMLLMGRPVPFGSVGKVHRPLWDLATGCTRQRHTANNAAARSADRSGESDHDIEGDVDIEGDIDIEGDNRESDSESARCRVALVEALRANAAQVARYLRAYAAAAHLPAAPLAALLEAYTQLSGVRGRGDEIARWEGHTHANTHQHTTLVALITCINHMVTSLYMKRVGVSCAQSVVGLLPPTFYLLLFFLGPPFYTSSTNTT